MGTQTCVGALKAALEAEKLELQSSASAANGVMTDPNKNTAGSEAKIIEQRRLLQKALHKALETTYMNIHNEYKRVRLSAKAMMDALHKEVSARNCAGTDNPNSGKQLGKAGTAGSDFQDCQSFSTDEPGNTGTGQEIFKQIVAATAKQLSPTDMTAFDAGNPGGFSATVLNILSDLMLANANEEVIENLGTANKAEYEIVEKDLIKIASILAGPREGTDYNVEDKTDANSHAAGGHISQAVKGTNHGHGTDTSAAGDRREDNRNNMANANAFERAKVRAIETSFVEYVKSKSVYHNTSTKQTALEAAVNMIDAKIRAVGQANGKISSYTLELKGLEDDEMRKIHDIKEEFESLAADWLQLATYHCCDIVQGNAIECDDATAHLIAPINTVFPNALRKPNVQTDCTRRLL